MMPLQHMKDEIINRVLHRDGSQTTKKEIMDAFGADDDNKGRRVTEALTELEKEGRVIHNRKDDWRLPVSSPG